MLQWIKRLGYVILGHMPDKIALKIWYCYIMGRKLNLTEPKRFTEKQQWYKLYYRNDLMTQCSDKYSVRKYVELNNLGHILNELYGVYDSPDEIDFDKLPDEFIIKMNNSSGLNIIVEDKTTLDINKTKAQLQKWLRKKRKYDTHHEWCYNNIEPKIIIEKLIVTSKRDLPDYKFFCFDGNVFCVFYRRNYTYDHTKGDAAFLDRDFKRMPYYMPIFSLIEEEIEKPKGYDEMLKISEILSAPFPHVRVDLYNIDGKIVFGELTFHMTSGFAKFEPDEFDYILGKQFVLRKPTDPKQR